MYINVELMPKIILQSRFCYFLLLMISLLNCITRIKYIIKSFNSSIALQRFFWSNTKRGSVTAAQSTLRLRVHRSANIVNKESREYNGSYLLDAHRTSCRCVVSIWVHQVKFSSVKYMLSTDAPAYTLIVPNAKSKL